MTPQTDVSVDTVTGAAPTPDTEQPWKALGLKVVGALPLPGQHDGKPGQPGARAVHELHEGVALLLVHRIRLSRRLQRRRHRLRCHAAHPMPVQLPDRYEGWEHC